jgi:hypothetical protein
LIDFRYHLVSIVAVFLALAIGIVLGSTDFQGAVLAGLTKTSNSLHSQLVATQADRDAWEAKANAADTFLQTSESLLLGNGRLLAGHSLVLVTEPGAPTPVINGVKTAAADAGATVTGEVALQSTFNDLSGATGSILATINGSIAARDGITLAVGADPQTTYQQDAAQLIAAAILQKQDSQQLQQGQHNQRGQQNPQGQQNQQGQAVLSTASATTLLNAYAQAGFINIVSGTPTNRADLAVIVAPGNVPADGASDPANEVLVPVAQEFAGASAVTLIAGAAAPSGQAGSAISVVRSDSVSSKVSTIDNADTTQGQITVMQAIARQLAGGQPSSYGISGATSLSPTPAPTASQTATPGTQPTGQPTKTGNGGKQVNKK